MKAPLQKRVFRRATELERMSCSSHSIQSDLETGNDAPRWHQMSRVGRSGQPSASGPAGGRESAAALAQQRGPTRSSHSLRAMALVVAHTTLARPSALLLHLRQSQPFHTSRASREPPLATSRPFSSASQLPGLRPRLTRNRARGVAPTRSMAGGADREGWGGETEGRPEMLATAPYSPPAWASELHLVPLQFTSLGQFPTPIHRWNLPGLPKNTEVWIKRDDLTGMQLSGNKVRKLEFLMADAKAQGADCVITIGGIQSNHCRATAVAARYLGLDCYLILRTSRTIVEDDPGLEGNLLVERMVGAHVSLVSKEEYVQLGSVVLGELLEEKLKAEGRKPYVIPVGGSNSLGTWGYVEFVRELQSQLEGGKVTGIKHFDDIVMACGSGGTTAGLALAAHLSNFETKVHAYAVCDNPEYFYNYVQGLIDGLNAGVKSEDIVRIVNAKGLGYAMSTTEELKLVKEVAELTGVILDPVYSGKALNGMLKDMADNPTQWEGKKVLFLHTGGLLGMYDKVQQLQPLTGKWERFKIAETVLKEGDGKGKMF